MMKLWSRQELEEAAVIMARLRRHMLPEYEKNLEEKFDQLSGSHYENACGAYFELRMFNRLREHHLREAILEREVSSETKTSIDLYIPSLSLAVELQCREEYLFRSVLEASDRLPETRARQYMRSEANASFFYGNADEKQARAMADGIEKKCRKKRFETSNSVVWLMTDISHTDLLTQCGPPRRTQDEYFWDLGAKLTALMGDAATPGGGKNFILECHRLFFAFYHSQLANVGEVVVVFPRTSEERAAASLLADTLRLPLRLVPQDSASS